MKKIRLLLATGLLSGALCAQVTHVTQFNGKDFDFSKSKTVSVEKQNFTQFDLPIYPMKAIPGNPELPVKYVRLLIPPGQEVTDITINFQEANSYKLENVVYPIQEPVPVGETAQNLTLPNMDIYNADKPYPENVVELVSSGYFNGSAHVATFAVYPVQYYPTSNTLTEFSSVTFTVAASTPKSATKKPIAPNANNLKKYNSLLEQMVDNPADINKYKTETFESTTKSGVAYFEYVIITSSTLSSAFTDFINWKKLKGFDIGIVTWQDIRTNYPSGDLISSTTNNRVNDAAGSIRQYLKDAWQHGTVYCLIGGDMATVPARYGCGSDDKWTRDPTKPWTIDDNKIPTDLYYSDFNGDWNVDGDEFTGEYNGDDVEFEPEIFVGRLLCSTESHVNTWFTKLKLYENNPGNGDFSYLNNVLFTEADGLQSNRCMLHVNSWATTKNTLFELPSAGSLSPTDPSGPDVINEANNHYGLMSWFNHGSPHSVAMYTVGYNETINDTKSCIVSTDAWDINHGATTITESGNGFDNLTNVNYPSIVYTISCDNNPFDEWHTDAGYPNMGEAFTTWYSGGGAAYLGNSRYGYTYTSHSLMEAFLDRLQTSNTNNVNLQLGYAEAISKQNYQSHYVCLANNLLGCPETPFWAGEPNIMQLAVDYTNNKVRIYKEDGSVLSGAKVSFNYGGIYYFDTTDANGYAYVSVDITEDDEIGASYPGYLPVYTQHITSNQTFTEVNPIRGNLIIKSGENLTIAGNLIIPKYSKLIIEENATVTINSGYNLDINGDIELSWTGANLIVNGTLNIKNNSTISGNGYITLNGNINAEPGASLTIQGVSQNTKILEVEKQILFDSDFDNITIKNGKIVMNNSNANLWISNATNNPPNVTIDNVFVTSSTGSYNSHVGFSIASNGNVTVQNSTFEYGSHGLITQRGSTAPVININNCNFKYCINGLSVYNSGINIYDCTFEYNYSIGLYCSSMDQHSYITNCTIKYQNSWNDHGLYYTGSPTAIVNLNSNFINNNYYGAFIDGSFISSFKCNLIYNNTEYGIYADNTDIYLASTPGITGGGNYLSNNKYAVKIDGYGSFYLNDGYNDLHSSSYCMYGHYSSYVGGVIMANNNYWKTGGGAPINITDYVLSDAFGPIYLSDYSPNSYYLLCSSSYKSASDSELIINQKSNTSISYAPFNESFNYREVNTSIGILPLNEAVNQILNIDTLLGKVYDLHTQYELLGEVLINNFDELNIGEEWYVNHTYSMFKSDLGKFKKDKDSDKISTKLTDKILTIIHKLEKDITNDEKGLTKISKKSLPLLIDEAHILWYSGRYDDATVHLEKLLKKVENTEICDIKKLICQINVDKAFVESNNTLDIVEALKVCDECDENDDSNKSGSINKNDDYISEIKNKTINNYMLTIVPNPVSQSSEIEVFAPIDAELLVYNSAGQIMLKEVISTERYTKTISNTELSEGIYMVVVIVNGKTAQSQKMVVVK